MKKIFPVVAAFYLFATAGASAQTLSSAPQTSAPKATAQPKKQADPALAAKVNALIKKQPAAASPAPAKPVATSAPATAQNTPSASPQAPGATEVEKPKVPASQSKIESLITEREQLVLKYDYLKTQENNFWGKASKEDMRAVIDALKEVLKKDEEIIHAVEQANLETRRSVAKRAAELEAEAKKLNSQVQGDKRVVTDNIYDLKASLANAHNLNRRRDRQIKELEERLETANDAKFEHDAIATFLAMFSVVLVGYIVKLRNRNTELKKQKQNVNA